MIDITWRVVFITLADFDFRWGRGGRGRAFLCARVCEAGWFLVGRRGRGVRGGGGGGGGGGEGGRETEVDASKIFYLRVLDADAQYFRDKL